MAIAATALFGLLGLKLSLQSTYGCSRRDPGVSHLPVVLFRAALTTQQPTNPCGEFGDGEGFGQLHEFVSSAHFFGAKRGF